MRADESLEFDLAIVGGGMAGITLAERLRSTGKRICVIEGGGVDPEAPAQQLFAGENVGRGYFELGRCRFRVLGGSSIRWGAWSRPLDPVDFTARDWIAHSGWPIGAADLDPYYADAARLIDLETDSFDMVDWAQRLSAPPTLATTHFTPAVIQHGRAVDFGEEWRDSLAAADNVTVLLHANATELVLAPAGDRLDHVRIKTVRGRSFVVRATEFVLAAGGIENARLLLASRERRPEGVGNESDQVGRYFMEHLHVASGHLVGTPAAELPPFFHHGLGHTGGGGHGVLTPTEAALARCGLPSCSISLSPAASALGIIPRLNSPSSLMVATETAARRLHRSHPAVDAAVRRAVLATWKAGRATQLRRQARRSVGDGTAAPAIVHVRAEQVPNRESRVTLADTRDALGMPRARLDWQLTDQDLSGVARWTTALGEAFAGAGLGRVVAREQWESDIIGGPHHMGTTRMSASPDDGVVDADCRVHSVTNLFVAGSSVFTTSGHAHPSLSVLALTLRLADHLRDRLGATAQRDVLASR